jgi:hypothetical protein
LATALAFEPAFLCPAVTANLRRALPELQPTEDEIQFILDAISDYLTVKVRVVG